MNNIKLTKVFENEYGIHVMVKSSAFIKINESEFFLITESTIRKGIRCKDDSEFMGLFKRSHVADEENNTAACWVKVY
mgnify:CR=1 FL=1